jgi:hypothetical protein
VKVLEIMEAAKTSKIIVGISINSNQLPLKHTASLHWLYTCLFEDFNDHKKVK